MIQFVISGKPVGTGNDPVVVLVEEEPPEEPLPPPPPGEEELLESLLSFLSITPNRTPRTMPKMMRTRITKQRHLFLFLLECVLLPMISM
jgi:hypothetical protein